jgi:P-type Mg2+ transporter
MPSTHSGILPKKAFQRPAPGIRVSPLLLEAATCDTEQVYQKLQTSSNGLSQEEAHRRLQEYGPNVVAQEQRYGWLKLLGKACLNPLVILLVVLAIVSFLTDDTPRAAIVMAIMVLLGVVLRFVQEARADAAAAKLKAMISVTATVLRDGKPQEVPLGDIVPGDVVRLAAGDMMPADLRLCSCKDLFIIQASLTGESYPVEKFDTCEKLDNRSALELCNICFLGTSVESGTGQAVVVATGLKTYLGTMASAIVGQQADTSFDKGIRSFTWLMIRFMMVMVPLVFFINVFTKSDWNDAVVFWNEAVSFVTALASGNWAPPVVPAPWRDAFFFAMAVAVGLTPEMLPMIVTVCLSKGAIAMSRKRVIVKQLNSIQNLGAMDVLCTDKTGTLTQDRIILEHHCDVVLKEDETVLMLAYLNSFFQTGLKNLLDRAILNHKHLSIPFYSKVDEIPFDFSRRIMSVVVKTPSNTNRIIVKGAPEEVLKRCTRFELDGEFYPIEHIFIHDLKEEYDQLSANGFRVLALAYKDLDPKPAYSKDDERDLILRGYVAFLDPPKDSARLAIAALREHGVAVKVLTGDNDLVSVKICQEVGLPVDDVLLGGQVEAMSDAALAEAADKTTLFARQSPAHKQRIIKALQSRGHVVGFLGDGINDAPALRAADVGVSVDTAVDIAKESADAILLEKNLLVLEEGVLEGRKVFANIIKYIKMGASSNFGNMFSVLGASAMLKFLPMQTIQLLTNNLLYDFSQAPIPTDDVDPAQIAKPQPWSMNHLTRFILFIGPCSSIFDYTTFFIMLCVFDCWDNASLFQTGWFVESLLTQTLIIHVIRTQRVPFIQSRASWPLTITTVIIMIIGMWLPFSPLAAALDFSPLPPLYWPLLVLTLFCYVVLTQLVKMWLLKKGWV